MALSLISFISSQFIGPVMVLDLPSFQKLEVVNIVHEDSEWFESDPFKNNLPLTPSNSELEYIPPRTIISIYSNQKLIDITINEETGELLSWGWNKLTKKYSEYDFETLIMGVPGIIISSPLLISNYLFWEGFQKLTGMERHAWSVWIRIKNQLDPKTYILAEKAFLKFKGNNYNREIFFSYQHKNK